MSEHRPSKRQTEDQRRAERAWKDIEQVDQLSDKDLKNRYRDLARKTPTSIQSMGLGQTLAFLRSKAKSNQERNRDEHAMLYQHVSSWVMSEFKQPKEKSDLLLEWVIRENTTTYRQATVLALAYLNWLKRFAEAVLPEK